METACSRYLSLDLETVICPACERISTSALMLRAPISTNHSTHLSPRMPRLPHHDDVFINHQARSFHLLHITQNAPSTSRSGLYQRPANARPRDTSCHLQARCSSPRANMPNMRGGAIKSPDYGSHGASAPPVNTAAQLKKQRLLPRLLASHATTPAGLVLAVIGLTLIAFWVKLVGALLLGAGALFGMALWWRDTDLRGPASGRKLNIMKQGCL